MAKKMMGPTILYLLFLVLAGSCTTMIALQATAPPQGAVIVPNVALPGQPDFSSEVYWINQIAQSPTARSGLRPLLTCVLLWAIAGVAILLFVRGMQYIREQAQTKQQHYAFDQTCIASEEWALCFPEEGCPAANPEQGKDN
jgi:hypothetical protein